MALWETEAGRWVFKKFAESEEATKFLETYEETQKEVRKREGKNSITEEANRNTRNDILVHRAAVEKARQAAETERRTDMFKFCPVCGKGLEEHPNSGTWSCFLHGDVVVHLGEPVFRLARNL